MQNEIHYYSVESKVEEAPDIKTLFLKHLSGENPSFLSGQYITIYFPELKTLEGKAYSISSAPCESSFSITVQAIGEFSNRLCALSPGDHIQTSSPYGFFYSESEDSPIIMIAAGIGIAPFRSMLHTIAYKNPSRRVCLFHSIRTSRDALFGDDLHTLKSQLPNLSVFYFITREKDTVSTPFTMYRRIESSDILSCGLTKSTEVLICGSISFTRDMWRMLVHAGIPEDCLYTEAFFSH